MHDLDAADPIWHDDTAADAAITGAAPTELVLDYPDTGRNANCEIGNYTWCHTVGVAFCIVVAALAGAGFLCLGIRGPALATAANPLADDPPGTTARGHDAFYADFDRLAECDPGQGNDDQSAHRYIYAPGSEFAKRHCTAIPRPPHALSVAIEACRILENGPPFSGEVWRTTRDTLMARHRLNWQQANALVLDADLRLVPFHCDPTRLGAP